MLSLVVRRSVRATPKDLFEAWTQPAHLLNWWGPPGVTCIGADVDLRVGGGYRIGNRMPDGAVIWISGAFETIEAPRLLVFTWSVGAQASEAERVTVRFEPHGELTEVIVVHERIADQALRDRHEWGWEACLDGLEAYLTA